MHILHYSRPSSVTISIRCLIQLVASTSAALFRFFDIFNLMNDNNLQVYKRRAKTLTIFNFSRRKFKWKILLLSIDDASEQQFNYTENILAYSILMKCFLCSRKFNRRIIAIHLNKTLFLHQIVCQQNGSQNYSSSFCRETPISMHYTHTHGKKDLINSNRKMICLKLCNLLDSFYCHSNIITSFCSSINILTLYGCVTNANNSLKCRLFTNRCKVTHFAKITIKNQSKSFLHSFDVYCIVKRPKPFVGLLSIPLFHTYILRSSFWHHSFYECECVSLYLYLGVCVSTECMVFVSQENHINFYKMQ